MTFGVERLEHPRRLLVALITAVLALVVAVGAGVDAHASTAGGQVAGNAVAAHELLAGPVVAASEDIAAGEGRRTTTLAPDDATGSRVAPQTARALPPADVAVIGKYDDLMTTTLRPGERTLLDQLTPSLGSPRANYIRNDSVLRAEMRRGVPIRDVSVDPTTGALGNNTGFLRAERNILTNHDWGFDPKSGYWYPSGW